MLGHDLVEVAIDAGSRMSAESVRAFLAQAAPDVAVIDLAASSSTATLSTEWSMRPAQIAKALVLGVGARCVVVVTCGDSRLDNRKVKTLLGGKARMLPPDEVLSMTGHPVGGVSPFG